MRAAYAMSSTQTGNLLRQKRLNRKRSREKASVADYLKDLIVFPSAPWYGSEQSGAPAFGCRLPEVIRCLHGFLFTRSVRRNFNTLKSTTWDCRACTTCVCQRNPILRRMVTRAPARIADIAPSTDVPTYCIGRRANACVTDLGSLARVVATTPIAASVAPTTVSIRPPDESLVYRCALPKNALRIMQQLGVALNSETRRLLPPLQGSFQALSKQSEGSTIINRAFSSCSYSHRGPACASELALCRKCTHHLEVSGSSYRAEQPSIFQLHQKHLTNS
jgi:hypothetical protein